MRLVDKPAVYGRRLAWVLFCCLQELCAVWGWNRQLWCWAWHESPSVVGLEQVAVVLGMGLILQFVFSCESLPTPPLSCCRRGALRGAG